MVDILTIVSADDSILQTLVTVSALTGPSMWRYCEADMVDKCEP